MAWKRKGCISRTPFAEGLCKFIGLYLLGSGLGDRGLFKCILVSSSLICLYSSFYIIWPWNPCFHSPPLRNCNISSDHEYLTYIRNKELFFIYLFFPTDPRGPLWKKGHHVPTFVSCHILGLFLYVYISIFIFTCCLFILLVTYCNNIILSLRFYWRNILT